MSKTSVSYKSKYSIKEKLKQRSLPHFSVYRALQTGLDREVEIRVFKVRTSQDSEKALERFKREYKILARLDHPNILKILDLGTEKDTGYYVTDLRNAESLSELLNNGTKLNSVETVIKIGEEIGRALSYIHEKNLLHRDLSINNIFYDRDNDFYYMGSFSQGKEATDYDVTARGIPFISPLISTPEIMNSLPIDHRTDIYLLGKLMYQLLTGNKDLTHYNEFEKETLDVTSIDARPVREFNAEVPQSLDDLIRKMVAAKPERRFQSVDDFLKELTWAKRKIEGIATLEKDRQKLIKKNVVKRAEKKKTSSEKNTDQQPSQASDTSQNKKEATAALSIRDYIEIFDEISPMLKYALLASLVPVAAMLLFLLSGPSQPSASSTTPSAGRHLASEKTNAELEKIQAITTPTDKDNFQSRYALLAAFRRSFPHKKRKSTVSYNALIESRVAFYKSEAEGCKIIDNMIKKLQEEHQ